MKKRVTRLETRVLDSDEDDEIAIPVPENDDDDTHRHPTADDGTNLVDLDKSPGRVSSPNMVVTPPKTTPSTSKVIVCQPKESPATTPVEEPEAKGEGQSADEKKKPSPASPQRLIPPRNPTVPSTPRHTAKK